MIKSSDIYLLNSTSYIALYTNIISYIDHVAFPCFLTFKGAGFTLIFFVKLDFDIAIDQQTRAHDQTFEGVPDSGCPPVPAGQPRPYLVNFCRITLTMFITML